jgi:SAM-dependent methyltransferase
VRDLLYRILDRPSVYRLQEALLAPGARARITRILAETVGGLPPQALLLDVGCGPSSWLFRLGLHPIGVDLSPAYLREYVREGRHGVAASADALPFRPGCFDGVWSIGLLHHLPDEVARKAVGEMMRVCRPEGRVVVFDAVLPEHVWRRPLAHLIRRLDRGRFMRSEPELRGLLSDSSVWRCERLTYAATGLEGLLCSWGPA